MRLSRRKSIKTRRTMGARRQSRRQSRSTRRQSRSTRRQSRSTRRKPKKHKQSVGSKKRRRDGTTHDDNPAKDIKLLKAEIVHAKAAAVAAAAAAAKATAALERRKEIHRMNEEIQREMGDDAWEVEEDEEEGQGDLA